MSATRKQKQQDPERSKRHRFDSDAESPDLPPEKGVQPPPTEIKDAFHASAALLPLVGSVGAIAAIQHLKELMTSSGYALFASVYGVSFLEMGYAIWLLLAYRSENKHNKKHLFDPILMLVSSALCAASGTVALLFSAATQTPLVVTFQWVMPLMLCIKVVSMLIGVVKAWSAYRKQRTTPLMRKRLLPLLLLRTAGCASLLGVTVGVSLLKTQPVVLLVAAICALSCITTSIALKHCLTPRRLSRSLFRRSQKAITLHNTGMTA